LLDYLLKALPKGKRLVEPFAGSAALFLNAPDYKRYLIAEKNADIVALYQSLQEEGEAFITDAKTYYQPRYNDEATYYKLRDKFNNTRCVRTRAILFLYLNRHGYKGLSRYNSRGEFNVPYGFYKKPYFPESEMHFFIERAKNAKFMCQDFAKTLKQVRAGDVVYCDPPYVPWSKTAAFTSYHTAGFDMDEQARLCDAITDCVDRGASVVVSNHDLPVTRAWYADGEIISFKAPRSIRMNEKQKSVRELLAVFHGQRP